MQSAESGGIAHEVASKNTQRPTLNAELPMNRILAGVARSQGRGGVQSWTFGVRCSQFGEWLAEA
jgi:hypothetical protein